MLDTDGIYRVVNRFIKYETPSRRLRDRTFCSVAALQSGPAGGGMVAAIIDTSKLPST